MGNYFVKRAVSTAAAICVFSQQLSFTPPEKQNAAAAVNYTNADVASQGTADGSAVIKGRSASVVYDEQLRSNVLSLKGDSFGSGWLQLPSDMFSKECSNGFSFSLKFKLESDAGNYTRLYQFSPVPFGAGTAPSYSSPDISVDL